MAPSKLKRATSKSIFDVALLQNTAILDDRLPIMQARYEAERRHVLRDISASLDLRVQLPAPDASSSSSSSSKARLVSGKPGEEETWNVSSLRGKDPTVRRELINRELVSTVAEYAQTAHQRSNVHLHCCCLQRAPLRVVLRSPLRAPRAPPRAPLALQVSLAVYLPPGDFRLRPTFRREPAKRHARDRGWMGCALVAAA